MQETVHSCVDALVSGPHDSFVKRVLANPAHAAAELAAILPPQLVARIDWSSLLPQSTSFIDEQLQGRFADLVFTARIDQHEGVIYILWEHQSSDDPLIVFRMLGYMVRIWDNLVREDPSRQTLPLILPVLLQHGGSRGASRIQFAELLDIEPNLLGILQSYVPTFKVVLEDLDRLGIEELRQRRLPAEVELMLFLLKRARVSPALLEELAEFVTALETLAKDRVGLATVVRYILEVREESPDEVQEFFRKRLGPVGVVGFMTGAQQLTQQVRADGEARGEAKGKTEAILRVLGRRGIELTEAQRAMIVSTSDIETLNRWLDRSILADSASEVFA